MAKRIDRCRLTLDFLGPDKDIESRVFMEVFRASYGAPMKRRFKRDRLLYAAVKAIAEIADLDAAARKKHIARLKRAGVG